jgi:hypothetical protein
MSVTDENSMLPLIKLVHGTGTYQDRLRSTNATEFVLDSVIEKPKDTEFVRDTTLDPK